MNCRIRCLLLALAFCAVPLASGPLAQAASLSLSSPNYLTHGTGGQVVDVFVTGGEQIAGVEFIAEVVGAPGGPVIEFIDLENGTIWSGKSLPQTYPVPAPGHSVWAAITVTNPLGNPAIADGKLGSISLNTFGGAYGDEWQLNLFSFLGSLRLLTPFGDEIILDQTSALLVVVPEPASIVMGLVGACAISLVALRRRRAG